MDFIARKNGRAVFLLPPMKNYGDRLRQRAGLSARIDEIAREITPAVQRHLAGDGRTATSTAPRKRQRSPSASPLPSDDEEEEEEDDEEDTPGTVATPITGPSITIPHSYSAPAGTSAATRFVPIGEAFDETLEIVAFYQRRTFPVNAARCFLCEYGNKTHDNSPDFGCRPYVMLLRLATNNYAFMSLEALGNMCYEFYGRTILQPMNIYIERHGLSPSDFSLPPMSGEAFATHFKWHNFNPVIMIGESLRDTSRMIEVVKNRTIRRDKDEVDPKMIDAYAKLVKTQALLMNMKRDKLFFNTTSGESLDLDPSKQSTLSNMRRVESLLVNTRNTIGGQTALDTAASTGDAHRTNFTADVYTTVASTVSRDDLQALGDIVGDATNKDEPDAMDIDE
jgi:hypothetical protein